MKHRLVAFGLSNVMVSTVKQFYCINQRIKVFVARVSSSIKSRFPFCALLHFFENAADTAGKLLQSSSQIPGGT